MHIFSVKKFESCTLMFWKKNVKILNWNNLLQFVLWAGPRTPISSAVRRTWTWSKANRLRCRARWLPPMASAITGNWTVSNRLFSPPSTLLKRSICKMCPFAGFRVLIRLGSMSEVWDDFSVQNFCAEFLVGLASCLIYHWE